MGATIPGFAVRGVVPGKQLVLAGHHRFSRYALVFTIEPAATGATLSAQTTAEFPGVLGWAYRLLVIHSGAHRIVTRRFLRGIAAHA
ncbi:hypothetical protein [Microbacterium sp. zg-YB36]|uniref:hypothetical protein n=1 Tax=Microbacterium sp. zg-YB36 TaxID=2969407 RepID=UPI00214B401D|nr:hypothetical protein [Microbacterium sp. zg-YB36]